MKKIAWLLLLLPLGMSHCQSLRKTAQVPADARGSSGEVPLEGTYWRLTELHGKPVDPAPTDRREVYVRLRKEENRLEGFAGCNSLMGRYTLSNRNRLRFQSVGSTRMACPENTTESEFLNVLETADSYTLSGRQLVLTKARMAPLARFEARDLD
ncbi:hypothetical protein GCM10027275_45010 [Rhabdobacter roseus]|uniref:Heat shock protein HslJ n=1 Tax=Rhabdobacter roseus TaxID=1655419 RepID=A0A840U407_9BACT|nr:META domain-containing protein [Rhabdobacter roseus]MBB5286830.1 heat shock protein HslJ [Rhabdobacter roseus]